MPLDTRNGTWSSGNKFTIGDEAYTVQSPDKDHSFGVFARNGIIARFEVRPGEQWANDTIKGKRVERCELRQVGSLAFATNYWASWSLMIGDFEHNASFLIMGQIHAGNTGGQRPPWFAVQLQDNALCVIYRDLVSNPDANRPRVLGSLPNVDRNVWHHVVVKTRAARKNGELTVWINGVELGHHSGPLGYDDDHHKNAGYWKFGIYRGRDTSIASVSYANIDLGTTDLSCRISKPRSI